MERFRHAIESGDIEAAIATLAADVVFQSPVVFKPYVGRDAVGMILRLVATVFEDFHYVSELHAGEETALVFRARVGDKALEGVDWLRVPCLDGRGSERARLLDPRRREPSPEAVHVGLGGRFMDAKLDCPP
jgi:hypothetical protein